MNKSILVIDTPKSCLECDILDNDELTCMGMKVGYGNLNNRQTFCPLKPLLRREDIYEEMYLAYGLWKEEYYERMRDAVDKVLDEILGEQYE